MSYAFVAHLATIPGWLETPSWFWPLTRVLGHFVRDHQALGLFLVIFAEELGIPLPAPGDVAIVWGGYLTTTGAISYPLAYLAVIAGATVGSFCLYRLSGRFGHPFLVRFGPYVGLYPERLDRAERAFQRWGPWAIIIGRHIPGMRIVLSAFAGVFEISPRVFVVCVLVSSSIWAAIFLTLGRLLGRNSRRLFHLVPVHLLPVVILLLVLLWVLWLAYDRSRGPARSNERRSGQKPDIAWLRCDIISVMSDNKSESLIPLDRVMHDSEVVILPDFPAIVDGKPVWVTAVLDRTAVVEPAPGEPKILVNRQHCLVNPSAIRFGYVAARDAARRGREAARRNRAAGQGARPRAA